MAAYTWEGGGNQNDLWSYGPNWYTYEYSSNNPNWNGDPPPPPGAGDTVDLSGGTIQSDGATVGALEPGGGGALIGGLTVLSGDFPEGTTLDGGVFSAADADEVTLLAGALDLFGESDGSTVECDVSCVPRNGIGAETLTTASYVSDQPSLS